MQEATKVLPDQGQCPRSPQLGRGPQAGPELCSSWNPGHQTRFNLFAEQIQVPMTASTQLPSSPVNRHVVQGVGRWQAEGSLCRCLDATHTHKYTQPPPHPQTHSPGQGRGKWGGGGAPSTAADGPKGCMTDRVPGSAGRTGRLSPPEEGALALTLRPALTRRRVDLSPCAHELSVPYRPLTVQTTSCKPPELAARPRAAVPTALSEGCSTPSPMGSSGPGKLGLCSPAQALTSSRSSPAP